MFKANKESISRDIDYLSIAISNNSRILVIGGGKAAYIKIKSLIKKSMDITVVAKEFIEEIKALKEVKLIREPYNDRLLEKYHLIIIAINDDLIRMEIKRDCEKLFKLYIDSTEGEKGLAIMQSQRTLKNISYSVNTKVKAPKLSKLYLGKIEEILKDYDDFTLEVGKIREGAKRLNDKEKKEIINFICTEDFKFFYDKKKSNLILKLFFANIINNKIT
ncbi:MAG: NAD(P)-dependent oxidoreductase [Sarcina sp.]